MSETPPTLAYATPDLRAQPMYDKPVNLTSGLQLMFATLVCAALVCDATAMHLSFGLLCMLVQWPGYLSASGVAFAGSLPRYVERRQSFYRTYVIAYAVLVGIALFAVAVDLIFNRGDSENAVLFIAYPVAALFANPALIVIGWRWLRRTSAAN